MTRYSSSIFAAALIASAVARPETAHAGWSNDPTVNTPVCTASGVQEYPRVLRLDSGRYLVAWHDERAPADSTDLYAQCLTADGVSVWAPNGVPVCTRPGAQWWFNNPDAYPVSDGAGGAFVAWTDERTGDRQYDVYAQHLDPSGAPLWAADGMPIAAGAGVELEPTLLADGAGGVFAVWVAGDYMALVAQHLDANGSALWAPGGVTVCESQIPQDQMVVADGQGGLIMAWADFRPSSDNGDIYAQRIDAAGTLLWAVNGVPVIAAPGQQVNQDMIPDGAGGAIVTWMDLASDAGDIRAQRMDATGQAVWTAAGVPVCTAHGAQAIPNAVTDGAGGAIVAWSDSRADSNNVQIYAQRLDPSGSPMWLTDGVPVRSLPGTSTGTLAAQPDGRGGMFMAWSDGRSPGGIYSQRIRGDGSPVWAVNGVAVGVAPHSQAYPRIAMDGARGAVIVWRDQRNDGGDVYAQYVDSLGSLGGTAAVSRPSGPPILTLRVVGPQPSIGKVRWRGELAVQEPAHLAILDTAGRLVRRLQAPGSASAFVAEWDGRDLNGCAAPSGVYFARLVQGRRAASARAVLLH